MNAWNKPGVGTPKIYPAVRTSIGLCYLSSTLGGIPFFCEANGSFCTLGSGSNPFSQVMRSRRRRKSKPPAKLGMARSRSGSNSANSRPGYEKRQKWRPRNGDVANGQRDGDVGVKVPNAPLLRHHFRRRYHRSRHFGNHRHRRDHRHHLGRPQPHRHHRHHHHDHQLHHRHRHSHHGLCSSLRSS